MNRHSGHRGEIGRANEASLYALFESLVPTGFGVGSGVIFNALNNRSNQTDVVIFNQVDQPRILAQTTQTLFPIETVAAAVEVKTKLTVEEVADAGAKIKRVRDLLGADVGRIHYSIFGYNCGNSHPFTIARAINELDDQSKPDSACLLMPASFGDSRKGVPVGLVPVHERDGEGRRMSRKWQVVGRSYGMSSAFPAVNLVPKQSDRKLVTEPGRALLLYADSLLTHLTGERSAWLSAYMPDISREVFRQGDVPK